jgi:hypothetical protein
MRIPDGRLIAWEDDWTCGCCKAEEEDRCVNFWYITEADLEALKRKQA